MDTVRLIDLLIDVQEQLETLSEISSPEDYNQGRSIYDLMDEIQHFLTILEEG